MTGSGWSTSSRAPPLGVLVCSPLHAEMQRNYRREVLLSRRLASAGAAVERFHYRGTGNSAGEPGRLALDTMIEDGIAAVHHLQQRVGGVPLVVLGTRVGGLVAAAVAVGGEGSRSRPVATAGQGVCLHA